MAIAEGGGVSPRAEERGREGISVVTQRAEEKMVVMPRTWLLITCIYNLNSSHISLIFMLILCNYDACYRNFHEFSPLVCHYTKVHIYA